MVVIERTSSTGRYAVRGEMTVYTVRELRDQLVAGSARELDLEGVTEFDSAGAQLLLALRAQVTACSESVRELIDLYRLGDVLLNGGGR